LDLQAHRCGFVALVGLPNVGKSTLFNALIGQKVSIVTPKPQTTRLTARGIISRPAWQAVLVDTPGFVGSESLMESGMRESAVTALKESDLVLYLACPGIAACLPPPVEVAALASKTVVVVTKADRFKKGVLLAFKQKVEKAFSPSAVFEVSAVSKKGLPELLEMAASRLPEGPSLYPEDEITDQTLRQSAAEIIREKALFYVQEEVPHGLAVEIEEYTERPDGLHAIRATLYVERESQKGIVIGKAGAGLKRIGTAARLEMEKVFATKVFLTVWVKVAKNWKKDEAFLKRMGFPVGMSRREK
jgi:GTPase